MKPIRVNKFLMPAIALVALLGSVWIAKAAGVWQTSGRGDILLDEQGNPDESTRTGTGAGGTPPPIPASVDLPREAGRLVIPMYELAAGAKAGTVKERRVTCTHRGEPVLETVFVLQH